MGKVMNLLSVTEAMKRLNVSKASFYRAVNRGDLTIIKLGGRTLVHPDDLNSIINASRVTKGL